LYDKLFDAFALHRLGVDARVTEYTRDFASWHDALPFALAVARKLARRCPFVLDVDSLVMEALWRAQVGGAVLSKGYVHLRISGAVKDEMRRVAEGQRGNYQGAGAFLDVDDAGGIVDGSLLDVEESIDRRRGIDSLPRAARHLVGEVIAGKSLEEIAEDLRVTPARISQVVAQLRAKPSSVTRLPGTVDLRGELQRAAQKYLTQAIQGTTSSTALAQRIGAARTTAFRWVGPDQPLPQGIIAGTGGPLQAHLHGVGLGLVGKAFVRSKGSVDVAARLLGCSVMTARRWWRQLPESAVDRRVRQDLSTATMIELRGQGLTSHAIGKRLGCTGSAVRWRLARCSTQVPRAATRVTREP
jgi:DNA-directed RNA polymerase specialized sigma24 family protein